jgi:hypothetical protein
MCVCVCVYVCVCFFFTTAGTSRHFVADDFSEDLKAAKEKCTRAMARLLLLASPSASTTAGVSGRDDHPFPSSLSLQFRNGLDFHEDQVVLNDEDVLFFANLDFVFKPILNNQTAQAAIQSKSKSALYHLSTDSLEDIGSALRHNSNSRDDDETPAATVRVQSLRDVDFSHEFDCDSGVDCPQTFDPSLLSMKKKRFRRLLVSVTENSATITFPKLQLSDGNISHTESSIVDKRRIITSRDRAKKQQQDTKDLLDFANYLVIATRLALYDIIYIYMYVVQMYIHVCCVCMGDVCFSGVCKHECVFDVCSCTCMMYVYT